MSETIHNILKSVACEKDRVATFICDDTAYPVDRSGYCTVMKEYCEETYRVNNISLQEVREEIFPCFFDFIFRFPQGSSGYAEGEFLKNVDKLQHVIRMAFELSSPDDLARAVVLDTPIMDSLTDNCSIMHSQILFPLVTCNRDTYINKVIPIAIRELEKLSVITGTKIYVEGLVRTVSNSTPLIYSNREGGLAPYTYMSCVPYRSIAFSSEQEFDPLESSLLDEDENIFCDMMCTDLSPLIMSQHYLNGYPSMKVDNHILEISNFSSSRSNSSRSQSCNNSARSTGHTASNFATDMTLPEDDKEELCHIFLAMWNPSTFMKWDMFMIVGEALFDAINGNVGGIDVWARYIISAINQLPEDEIPLHFSEKGKDVYSICDDEWCVLKRGRITWRTLSEIAENDDKEAYEIWHNEWCREALELATSSDHYDVGLAYYRVNYKLFITNFVGKGVTWFQFKNQRLREVHGASSVRIHLSREFVERIRSMRRELDANALLLPQAGKEKCDEIIGNIHRLIRNLKLRPYKMNIISEAADVFSRDNLAIMMDMNGDLLGTNNGVFVVNQFGIYHREQRIEDFVTKTIGAQYRDLYNDKSKAVLEMREWSHMTFMDDELEDYWWRMQASFLRGGNHYKRVFFWTGSRNNSKSAWEAIIESALGDYAEKLPASAFYSSFENSEGPSPMLASIQGCRALFIDELGRDKPLSDSKVKALSDKMKVRRLREAPFKMNPTYTPIFISNDPPSFQNGRTKSIETRLVCCPFLSIWEDGAPLTIDEQYEERHFPMDSEFSYRSERMMDAYLWIAVENYNNLIERGLRDVPIAIKQYTEDYWKAKDYFYEFIDDHVNMDTPDGSVSFVDLYDSFKEWHKSYFPNRKVMAGDQFKVEMTNRWDCKLIEGLWKGKSMKDVKAPQSNLNMLRNQMLNARPLM